MNHALILAGGQGKRMSMKKDKMLILAGNYPILYYSISAFHDHPEIDTITIVCNRDNKENIKKLIKTYSFDKVKKIIHGGDSRQQSVERGFKEIQGQKDDIVLVHNGANPLVSQDEITESIEKSQEHGAAIVGRPITSTIKEVKGKKVVKTHDRSKLFAAETPQSAKYQILKKAIDTTHKNKIEVTDEAMMLELIDQPIVYIEAHENNFKITNQTDFARLRSILGELPNDVRVGIGQDSHVFEDKELGLTFGGVLFEKERKLKANSDGDVILHAIFNGISQAIGDGSLGFYADEQFAKGITDSKKYLNPLLKKMHKAGFEINSLGLMLECKTPKIDPLVPKLKKSLAQILSLNSRRIGITATSGEEATAFGRGKGIQCFAIVSLKKRA
ncbi:2-C-methyl-D-erythritol 4-phosphate cytidylyltransferase [Candidatus Gracilibacteria bacterium]|nr:2-C-methyl-D-erythritol 4-phosphate cytidylyltransferase [Candidatus Gracilibacteria bacterium]